jgi:predicted TIM-barrel fold metal-dependent hydrolase
LDSGMKNLREKFEAFMIFRSCAFGIRSFFLDFQLIFIIKISVFGRDTEEVMNPAPVILIPNRYQKNNSVGRGYAPAVCLLLQRRSYYCRNTKSRVSTAYCRNEILRCARNDTFFLTVDEIMIIDSHIHIFSSQIISNVSSKSEMVKLLGLQTDQARDRIGANALEAECRAAGVKACLILPTAKAQDVGKINRISQGIAEEKDFLYSAGTLHPDYPQNREELFRLKSEGIRGIKLCFFSQGFALNAPKTRQLFDLIQDFNVNEAGRFFVILDTFCKADIYFGTAPQHNTTPPVFGELVRNYPKIKFIAAHMGGLTAPFEDIYNCLPKADNFYMDTSNAAHTLEEKEFVRLLELHGPDHILFGTDWPWFGYAQEIELIDRLLGYAGFNEAEKFRVFCGNISDLMEIREEADQKYVAGQL